MTIHNIARIRLDVNHSGPAFQTVSTLKNEITWCLSAYKPIFGKNLSIDEFRTWVMNFLQSDKETTRTIIGSFYSFVMEYRKCATLINIRVQKDTNIEPFVSMLFKGGLLFESMLKNISENVMKYPAAETAGNLV